MSENKLYRFFAVSDLHITQKSRGKNANKRHLAWTDIERSDSSFGLIAGDVTNGCGASEFDIAKAELEKLVSKMPVFIGYGNHDYLPNHIGAIASEESRISFSSWADEWVGHHGCKLESFGENRCFSTRFLDTELICLDCAASYPSAMAGEEQLAWLDRKLTETDNDRFRIVMSHFPLTNVVPSKTGRKQLAYVRDSSKQKRILEKHKNILFFSGHTHFTLDSDSPAVLYDEEHRVVYLNTASVGNIVPDVQSVKRGEAENTAGSMGLYVDVYERHIEIVGMDFLSGSLIDKCRFEVQI